MNTCTRLSSMEERFSQILAGEDPTLFLQSGGTSWIGLNFISRGIVGFLMAGVAPHFISLTHTTGWVCVVRGPSGPIVSPPYGVMHGALLYGFLALRK